MDALGFLEGYLTSERITQVLLNDNSTMWNSRPGDAREKLTEWFQIQDSYQAAQVKTYAHDPKASPCMLFCPAPLLLLILFF